MLLAQLLKLYKTQLVESLMIRQTMVEIPKIEGITTEEVTITVEAITMAETIHRMEMVTEIMDLIAATFAEVQEDVENFLIRLRIGWQQQRCMICIMLQILQNPILWHVHNHNFMRKLLVLEIT